MAKIAYSRGDLKRAHDLFERAIVVRPQHDKTVYHLAVVLYDMKQLDRARALFKEVCDGYTQLDQDRDKLDEPCDARTYHNALAMRGLIQQSMDDPAEARRLYTQVLQKDPEHILALDHYAALLAVEGESDEAAQLHKKVCALDPGHSKKACPYLDSLFPQNSSLFREEEGIERRIEASQVYMAAALYDCCYMRLLLSVYMTAAMHESASIDTRIEASQALLLFMTAAISMTAAVNICGCCYIYGCCCYDYDVMTAGHRGLAAPVCQGRAEEIVDQPPVAIAEEEGGSAHAEDAADIRRECRRSRLILPQ